MSSLTAVISKITSCATDNVIQSMIDDCLAHLNQLKLATTEYTGFDVSHINEEINRLKSDNESFTTEVISLLKRYINPDKCNVKQYDFKRQNTELKNNVLYIKENKNCFIVYNTSATVLPTINFECYSNCLLYIAYHKIYNYQSINCKQTAIFFNYISELKLKLNMTVESVFLFDNKNTEDSPSEINFEQSHYVTELYLHNSIIKDDIFTCFPLLNCLYLYDSSIVSTNNAKKYYINHIIKKENSILPDNIIPIHDTNIDLTILEPYTKIYDQIKNIYVPQFTV